jgi:signal transduction histidine kinase
LQKDLQTVQDESVRLQGLIDDLFTLARAEAGGLALDLRPVDTTRVIRRRVETMAPLAWQSKRVAVSADIAAAVPAVMADEGRLAQILANLLHNAIRHTLPGGIVVVAATGEEKMVRVDVRDTGEGISAQDLPLIWTRFYQSSSTQPYSGSAGLGLALVKELTEAMGGAVGVKSVLGEGSCFTIRLPRA